MRSTSVPEGPGSVSQAPNLPPGFTDMFTSQYVDIGELRLHAVVGGDGPPLLLVHGWPQSWYAWRMLMPALARDFRVVAVDQRGMGLSDKPEDGYDSGTQANDMVALMDALGHQRFAMVGTDTGLPIGYALAADHPDRIACVALAEVPGPPGAVPSPPMFAPGPINDRYWHIPFNRINKLNEQLVQGRERLFFSWEFTIQGGKLPDDLIDYYVGMLSNPDSLRGSFGFYRAWDAMMAQNEKRKNTRLAMPVLAIGGAASTGDTLGESMKLLANDVQTAVIPNSGHFVAEENPDALLAALTAFLAPYREMAMVGASRARA
jgi:pimeloyl-ACP methyl ester carboxylesterase